MKTRSKHLTVMIAAALYSVIAFDIALADDSEIFYGRQPDDPNILFIFDTSGSMSAQTRFNVYDPTVDYVGGGTCSTTTGRVYYSLGTQTTPPTCGASTWVNANDIKCSRARDNLARGSSGRFVDNLVRWGRSPFAGGIRTDEDTVFNWVPDLGVSSGTDIECNEDDGVDGNLTGAATYPRIFFSPLSGSNHGVWTTEPTESYWRDGSKVQYTLFSGNYVVWYRQHRIVENARRIDVLHDAAQNILDSVNSVNIGLMAFDPGYDHPAEGGMVRHAVAPIATARASLKNAVAQLEPNGSTPLSETYFEAYRYLSGGAVGYGVNSDPPSVANSRIPATANGVMYNSPADLSCQKNYIVYLTDGIPSSDSSADEAIRGLPDFTNVGGQCRGPTGSESDDGKCLGALAQYMANKDLRPDVPGEQKVKSYFIGFGPDFVSTNEFQGQLNEAFDYLKDAGLRGGGDAYTASDPDSLNSVFSNILGNIVDDATTFAAPTIAVNSFNRSRSLDNVYYPVFKPTGSRHWPGNVKKYRLVRNTLTDSAGNAAIDNATGKFLPTARSYWSLRADGNQVELGGAAANLPSPDSRRVFTWTGGSNVDLAPVDLTTSAQSFTTTNAAITDALLSTSNATDPARTKLINWARGLDVTRGNAARKAIGDALHSQPSVVIYGGNSDRRDLDDAVVFAATNDGYLHAINATTGVELWAFLPRESLQNLTELYRDQPVDQKHYALDGDTKIVKFDVNGDGRIDPAANDRVILYVSQGRGGSKYYALDITNKNAPKYMWGIGDAELQGIGQSWSTPAVARVYIDGATQNSQKLALIFGGGYDPADEAVGVNGDWLPSNNVGNRLFIVDAVKGTKLWSGGPNGASNVTQQFGARMTHAFPASPDVIDVDGDGFADRIYIGDLAAQLWRFDIWNRKIAGELVTGGILASLGARNGGQATTADARRFFNSPDSARVAIPGAAPFMAVAIGSGYRGHPLNTSIHDSFYVIRDYVPFSKMTQEQHNARAIVLDSTASLIDITNSTSPTLSAGAAGWKLRLRDDDAWHGEKVLSSAVTLGGSVMFNTYTPSQSVADCDAPATGSNRNYVVSVLDGSPTIDRNDDHSVDPDDRFVDLADAGIAAEARVIFPSHDTNGDGAPDDEQGGGADRLPPVCMVGRAVLQCPPANLFIKTFWREGGSN